jgi:hypothetical protein
MAKVITMLGTQAIVNQNGIVAASESIKVDYSYDRGAQLSVDFPNNAKGMVEFSVYDEENTLVLQKRDQLKGLSSGAKAAIVDGAAFQGPGPQPASGGYAWGLSTETGGKLKIVLSGNIGSVNVRCRGAESADFDSTTNYLSVLNGNGHYELEIPFTWAEEVPEETE